MATIGRLQQMTEHGRAVVKADFTLHDGRQGCVSVSAAEYAEHGDTIIMRQIEAVEMSLRRHGYREAEPDRYAEFR